MITDEQVAYIAQEIDRGKVHDPSLRNDLLDHMCCLVEVELAKGLDFDRAYQKAFLQTSPNGYEEIQKETLFLLNSRKIIYLKRLTYAAGFLFALLTSIGLLFKIMHLPGANVLLHGGLLALAFIFMPMLLINRFKSEVRGLLSERMKWLFGALSLALLSVAGVMKVLHWPGASVGMVLAFMLFGFGFLPFLFFRMYQSSLEHL